MHLTMACLGNLIPLGLHAACQRLAARVNGQASGHAALLTWMTVILVELPPMCQRLGAESTLSVVPLDEPLSKHETHIQSITVC